MRHSERYLSIMLSGFLLLLFLTIGYFRNGYPLWMWFEGDLIVIFWGEVTLIKLVSPLNTHLHTALPVIPALALVSYLVVLGRLLKVRVFIGKRRIHHYHAGLASSGLGTFLSSLGGLVSQGLGLSLLVGGLTFVAIDLKDFKASLMRRQHEMIP